MIFQLPHCPSLDGGGDSPSRCIGAEQEVHYLAYLCIGGRLEPTDIVSQVLMALPMLLLYELSILLCRVVFRQKLQERE